MPIFDRLQRASFAGVAFPIAELTVEGEMREHIHEYPHAPGGAPEKLGRKLYAFRMRAMFHATLRDYPNLFPRDWNLLRSKFESERSDDLVVPIMGTLKAYCVRWPHTMSARRRSGIEVELTFREDAQDAFGVNGLLVTSDTGMPRSRDELRRQAELFSQTLPGQVMIQELPDTPIEIPEGKTDTLGLLEALDAAIGEVLAIRDQIELANMAAETKLYRVLTLCQELERQPSIVDPRNHPLVNALRAVWSDANDRRRDIARRREKIATFITQLPNMGVTDVSRIVYGDTTRAMQILQLNHLPDPFNIPRGTMLRVYKPNVAATR